MRALSRCLWIGCSPLVLCLTGCSVLAPFYFVAVMLGMDNRIPPRFQFPDGPHRILVVTTSDLGTQVDVGHIERELNEKVARLLFERLSAERKFKGIQVIKASKLARWQDEHPDWHGKSPAEIGRALEADYVIFVEIDNFTLFEDGANRQLLQAKAEVSVSVVRVEGEEGEVVFPRDTFNFEFPKGRSIHISDITPNRFRREMLQRLAEQIVWYFVPHGFGEDFGRDPM